MFDMFVTGFSMIANPMAYLLILIGSILGIFFGAVPGMTSSMGIALVLPVTYSMGIVEGMAILLGIYIGSISGGLITAILFNIPGTPASIATTFDGYPMAMRGEGGKALRVGMFYSFLGGMFSLLVLFYVSPPLAKFALKFGPVEYFSIGILSLTLIASLSGDDLVKGIISAMIGVALTTIGMAPIDSVKRFTFGIGALNGGVQLLPVLIGVYAVLEILKSAENSDAGYGEIPAFKAKGLGVSLKEFKQQFVNFVRSSVVGTVIGILPGLGATISNILAYSIAKDSSNHPEKFGTGVVDGLIASETANNAVSGGAMIPMLTMGIPGDAGTAMLLAAFMLHGITPGPLLFREHGPIVYSIFAILIVANVFTLIIEMYGLKVFLKLLDIPKQFLYPIIIVLATIGAYGLNNRLFDVLCIFIFAVLGYVLDKNEFPLAPLVLGFVIGPIIELNLRRGLMSTYGSFGAFFTRPISAVVLVMTLVLLVFSSLKSRKRQKTART
ncbi:putative tricarboxylic transport membrane protein [Sphaerochaeta associata]|uniref:Tripartite tricarboxylate transporter permease n=1 Tax=Sphaerochaeta associata TaxID=1129264 RepID=A0ABY4DEU5_9SPIR|nr:tripartite tricarboxylate transporter permease [Sphaerochaeta associata]UOM51639.1 tripartite tricarboxylate transporter permease [Sphaerochaeta associata]SMP52543.1 putative tricarboxylic transport membrane protein [Sphaerochaeta associata]